MTRRYSIKPPDILPARGCLPERATAGAFLLRGKNLLLERRPRDARTYPGVWDTPGGHLESGETPEAALVREFEEELGILPTRFRLGLVMDDREPLSNRFYRHFVFIVLDWEGEPVSREGREIRWFTLQEAVEIEGLNPLTGFALQELQARGLFEDRFR